MEYKLKTPCKNCPFRTDDTAIRFADTERARDIAETAYRNGFPCHLSAEYVTEEEDFFGEGGYMAVEESQHCAGALIMFIKDGNMAWPGVDNDEELVERLVDQLDFEAPVFDSEEDFIAASDG